MIRVYRPAGGICLLTVLAQALVAASAAAVYHCTDDRGNSVYADAPCGNDAKAVDVVPPHPSNIDATSGLPSSVVSAGSTARGPTRKIRVDQCSVLMTQAWLGSANTRDRSPAQPIPTSDFLKRCESLIPSEEGNGGAVPQIGRAAPSASSPAIVLGLKDSILSDVVKEDSIEKVAAFLHVQHLDVNARSDADWSLLDHAAEQNRQAIARFLIEQGARVDASQETGPESGMRALHRAAEANAYQVASLLITAGATVNAHGPLGVTPLILAASNGGARTVDLLLQHGADISTPTGDRKTALSEAVNHNHPQVVRLILEHVPSPSLQTLSDIGMRGDSDTLHMLLQHDALVHDISSVDKDTTLRFAILGPGLLPEREQMIKWLIASGADVNNRVNHAPNTPLMLTASPEMAEFLISQGADLAAEGWYGSAADQLACNRDVKDPAGMLKVLFAHHANISRVPKSGRSGMQCAQESNHPEVIAFLQGHPEMTTAPPKPDQEEIVALRNFQMALAGNSDLPAYVETLAQLQFATLNANQLVSTMADPRAQRTLKQMKADLTQDLAPAFQESVRRAARNWDDAIAEKLSVADVHQLLLFYRSDVGREYLSFQERLRDIEVASGPTAMAQALAAADIGVQLRPPPPPSQAAIDRYRALLDLSWSMFVMQKVLAAGPLSAQAGAIEAVRKLMDEAAVSSRTEDLQSLQTRFSSSFAKFAAFQKSPAAEALLDTYQAVQGRVASDGPDPLGAAMSRSVAAHGTAWRTMLMPAGVQGTGAAVAAASASTPAVTVTRSGRITNVTSAGNLAATKPISCRPLGELDSTYTPADIWPGVRDCIDHERYAEAADLSALAGIYGAFDGARVTDVSAGQASQVLIITTLGAVEDNRRKLFESAVRSAHSDPKLLGDLCTRIRMIGSPSYYPDYMIMHGIRAFTGDPHKDALKSPFDGKAVWEGLRTTYLNCPGS
jgi:ankyrin repeat protein